MNLNVCRKVDVIIEYRVSVYWVKGPSGATCELRWHTMASEMRFTFSQVYDYLRSGTYPAEFSKADKRSLRKRADVFVIKGTKLYYCGK